MQSPLFLNLVCDSHVNEEQGHAHSFMHELVIAGKSWTSSRTSEAFLDLVLIGACCRPTGTWKVKCSTLGMKVCITVKRLDFWMV